PGADPAALADAVQKALRASPMYQRQAPDQLARLAGRNLIDFKLGPLADAYLDPDLKETSKVHANRQTVMGLAAVAVLILLLAATNYVNLATVRTLARQREIAVRKVLGASAPAVSRQFLAESVLVCLIATGIGLLLAWLVLPVFADLVQRKLDDLFSPGALAASLALGVTLGLAAGAYPTWSALSVRPTAALAGRGNSETASGLWLRRVLTVLQFATAMGLTGTTLAVAWQTRYASQLDPGFDPNVLLMFSTAADMRDANVRAFRDAVARVPGVDVVAEADAPVTVSRNSTSMRREGGTSIEINLYEVSPEFFQAYGLKPVSGRLYDPKQDKPTDEDRIVLNESGARAFGFASAQDAIGKMVLMTPGGGAPLRVIGVAPDIRHRSAREAMQPTVYFLSDRTAVFSVRSEKNLEGVQHAVEEMWGRFFPNDVLETVRVSSLFGAKYADDLRLAKLLAASSVIAIAIAAFGIYVLSAYSVQRRAREIVLRKLYGAGPGAIGKLVAREFAVLIGIGALAGLPMAWIATERYLSNFTERAPIGLWTVAAALAVAVLVALGSTLRHTVSAMRITPVLALRD
ncbi:MAG TPA: FtsX-like permease family protein, partial [Telluria sp.]|nr:FtsX-like permease family protein [Telluria sp.]